MPVAVHLIRLMSTVQLHASRGGLGTLNPKY